MDRHWPYTVLRAHCRLRRPGSWRCHGSWSESSTRKESCDHRLHSLVCRESQIGHKTAECTRSDALAAEAFSKLPSRCLPHRVARADARPSAFALLQPLMVDALDFQLRPTQ